MKKKMKIINVEFLACQEPSQIPKQTQQPLFEKANQNKIKQLTLKALQLFKEEGPAKEEKIRNLISEDTLQHYFHAHFENEQPNVKAWQLSNQLEDHQKPRQIRNGKVCNRLASGQRAQRERIQKLNRKLSECVLYIKYTKQKLQRLEKQLSSKNEEISRMRKQSQQLNQKIKSNLILKQLSSNSDQLLNKFFLSSAAYQKPHQLYFKLDCHNPNAVKQTNFFYRTCCDFSNANQQCTNSKNKDNIIKNNRVFADLNNIQGNSTQPKQAKTGKSQKNRRQLRKSNDKWTISNKKSTTVATDKENKNIGEGLVITNKELNGKEGRRPSRGIS